MRSDIHFIHDFESFLVTHFFICFITPKPSLALASFSSKWLLKESLLSRIIPRCLVSLTFFTGIPLKVKGSSCECFFLFENKISTACLVISGLNTIFHCPAHSVIFSRSLLSISVQCWLTTVKIKVSSAKILISLSTTSTKSFMYIRKRRGSRKKGSLRDSCLNLSPIRIFSIYGHPLFPV